MKTDNIGGVSHADLRDGVPSVVPGVGKDCEFAGQPPHTYSNEPTLIALPKNAFTAQPNSDSKSGR
jgi:hypothetical protein